MTTRVGDKLADCELKETCGNCLGIQYKSRCLVLQGHVHVACMASVLKVAGEPPSADVLECDACKRS